MKRTLKKTKPKPFIGSGLLLKEMREQKGWSQRYLGEMIGAHAQFISNSERGFCALTDFHVQNLPKTDAFKYLKALLEDQIQTKRLQYQNICSQLGIQTQ